jgi:putative ATP-dependent endonuclease of the OLD family
VSSNSTCNLPHHIASCSPPNRPSLVLVVEGAHDLHFLTHISQVLHAADPYLPDLEAHVTSHRLLMFPVGGSHLMLWTERLKALSLPELHLYDRETEPETALRQSIVQEINLRPGCFAALTHKRALENYLHPLAISRAGGPGITVTDDCCVAELVARQQFEARPGTPSWNDLTRRGQRRLAQRTKRWLHRWVTPLMTPELLDERDTNGEVRGWLRFIASHLT